MGGSDKFLTYALQNFHYMDNSHSAVYSHRARQAFSDAVNCKTSKFVVLPLSFDYNLGEVVIELFTSVAPRTCENFEKLCLGYERDGLKISYAGSEVNRVVKGMFIQLGKIPSIEKASIYGGEFADESFHVKHTQIGLVGMCKRNGLKHTNDS